MHSFHAIRSYLPSRPDTEPGVIRLLSLLQKQSSNCECNHLPARARLEPHFRLVKGLDAQRTQDLLITIDCTGHRSRASGRVPPLTCAHGRDGGARGSPAFAMVLMPHGQGTVEPSISQEDGCWLVLWSADKRQRLIRGRTEQLTEQVCFRCNYGIQRGRQWSHRKVTMPVTQRATNSGW